jgi:hypothetical protein
MSSCHAMTSSSGSAERSLPRRLRLFLAGCSDAGIESGPNGTSMSFARDAGDWAIKDVEKMADLRVVGAGQDERVTLLILPTASDVHGKQCGYGRLASGAPVASLRPGGSVRAVSDSGLGVEWPGGSTTSKGW